MSSQYRANNPETQQSTFLSLSKFLVKANQEPGFLNVFLDEPYIGVLLRHVQAYSKEL